ncbi:hypothetical protein [Streptomyces sp. PvR034]
MRIKGERRRADRLARGAPPSDGAVDGLLVHTPTAPGAPVPG